MPKDYYYYKATTCMPEQHKTYLFIAIGLTAATLYLTIHTLACIAELTRIGGAV